MGFLQTVKSKTVAAVGQAKAKVRDVKAKRKADDKYAELGRVVYRQHNGTPSPEDAKEIERLVAELDALTSSQ
jgi:hypothetical protein